MDQGEPPNIVLKKPNLTAEERKMIISMLLDRRNNHGGILKLADGSLSLVANFFHRHRSTVQRLWKIAEKNMKDPLISCYTSKSGIKGNSGRKKKVT